MPQKTMGGNSTKNAKNGTELSYAENTRSNIIPEDSGTCVDSGACSATRGHTGTPNDLGTNGQPSTPDDHCKPDNNRTPDHHGTTSTITGNSVQTQNHAMPRDEALLNQSSSVPDMSTVDQPESQLLLRNHVREKRDVEKLGEMVPVAAKASEEDSLMASRQGLSLPIVHTEPLPVLHLGSLSEQTGTGLKTRRTEKQIATETAFAELLSKKLKLSEATGIKSSVSSPLRRKSKFICLQENHDDDCSDPGESDGQIEDREVLNSYSVH